MAKICLILGTLILAAGCNGSGQCNDSQASCVSTAACFTATATTETCGVGLVCCPPVQYPDGGSDGG